MDQNDGNVDYWELLEHEDKTDLFSRLLGSISTHSQHDKMMQWLEKNQKILLNSYIDGLQKLNEESFNISFYTFSLMIYAILHKNEGDIKENIELKPQSLNLQKELNDIYTQENIDNAINELGIFTDKSKGNKK